MFQPRFFLVQMQSATPRNSIENSSDTRIPSIPDIKLQIDFCIRDLNNISIQHGFQCHLFKYYSTSGLKNHQLHPTESCNNERSGV